MYFSRSTVQLNLGIRGQKLRYVMGHYLAKPPKFSTDTGFNVAMVEIAHFTDMGDQAI